MTAIITNPNQLGYVTSDDLLNLPSELRYELIRGKLIDTSPPPGGEHGVRTNRLSARATLFAEDHDLGFGFAAETGFKIASDPDTVLAPDWAFISRDRMPSPIPRGHVPVVPDIVLETRSPKDSAREVAQKVGMWLEAGVRIVWELDPANNRLAIHRKGITTRFLGSDKLLTGEDVLPGFELPLTTVFD